jgi:hypothetical protein
MGRNWRCGGYDNCLMNAAKADLPETLCDGCARVREWNDINFENLLPAARLLLAIFYPDEVIQTHTLERYRLT